jgi:hypothetical protein
MKNEAKKIIVLLDDLKKGRAARHFDKNKCSEEFLKKENKKGYGIFETVNEFKSVKRKKEELLKLVEVYADLDVKTEKEKIKEKKEVLKKELLKHHCPPTRIIETKNGLQPRWKIKTEAEEKIDLETQIDKYTGIIEGIIDWSKKRGCKGDEVKDVTRVLRMPGYWHMKDFKNPFLITEEKISDNIYTLDELKKCFWREKTKKEKTRIAERASNNWLDLIDIKRIVIDVWNYKGHIAYFDKDNHLHIDGVETATFVNREGNNFVATTSGDYPAKGNAVTYVAETLGVSTKEAYRWLCDRYSFDRNLSVKRMEIKEKNKNHAHAVRNAGIVQNESDEWELNPISLEELRNKEFPNDIWLIDKLITEQSKVIISGPPGHYKSWILLLMAISISSGKNLFGRFKTKQQGCLIMDEENSERNLASRIKKITDEKRLPVFFGIHKKFNLNAEMIEKTIDFMKEKGLNVIFFDSLRRIHKEDENKSEEIKKIGEWIDIFTQRGITVIIIHHHRKQINAGKKKDVWTLGEEMRGSGDILGMIDSQLVMMVNEKNGEKELYFYQTKQRETEIIKPFKVGVENDIEKNKLNFEYLGEIDENINKIDMGKERVMEILENDSFNGNAGVTRKELAKALAGEIGMFTLKSVLKQLKDENAIEGKTKKEIGLKDGNPREIVYFLAKDKALKDGNFEHFFE